MSPSRIWLIFKKEMREALRDRSVLFMLFIMPFIILPLYFLGIFQVTNMMENKWTNEVFKVVVFEDYQEGIPEEVFTHKQIEVIKVKKLFGENSVEEIKRISSKILEDNHADTIVFGNVIENKKEMHIYIRGDSRREIRINNLFSTITNNINNSHKDLLLEKVGLKSTDLILITLKEHAHKKLSQRAGGIAGDIIGAMILLIIFLNIYFPASASIVGEVENQTLSTTLMAPVKIDEILIGKFLKITCIGLSSLIPYILELLAIFITFPDAAEKLSLFNTNFLYLLPLVFYTACLLSSVTYLLASFANNMKQIGVLVNVLLFGIFIPTVTLMIVETELTPLIMSVPLISFPLLFKEIVKGTVEPQLFFINFFMSTIYIFIFLRGAAINTKARNFLSVGDYTFDEVLSIGKIKLSAPSPNVAFLTFFVTFLTIIYVPQSSKLESGILLQMLTMLLIVALIHSLYKMPIKPMFNKLENFFSNSLLSFLLAIIFSVFMMSFSSLFPTPDFLGKTMGKTFEDLPTWKLVFLMGVLPGIIEELIFRGIILRGLLKTFPKVYSVVLCSLMFAFVHLYLFKLIPVFVGSLFICYLFLQTKNVLHCMIFHTTYNSFLIYMTKNPSLIEPFKDLLSPEFSILYFLIVVGFYFLSTKVIKSSNLPTP